MSEEWDEKNVGHFFVLDLVSPASKSGFQKLFKSQHFNKNDYAMPVCLIILHGQLSSMTCRFQTRHFLCVLVRNSFSAFSSTNFFLKSVFGKFSSCFYWPLTVFLAIISCSSCHSGQATFSEQHRFAQYKRILAIFSWFPNPFA